jgi:hypothetical protein
LFEAGRVYYCQHYTPELVWRREWMSHANGSTGLSELTVVTETVDTDLSHYSMAAQATAKSLAEGVWAIDLPDSFRITLLSPARYRERYGQLCIDAGGRRSFFGAIVLKAPDLGRIPRDPAVFAGLRTSEGAHSLALSLPSLNTLLEFRSDR